MLKNHSRELKAAPALLVAVPLFAVLHEALLIAAAWLVRSLFQTTALQGLAGLLVADPVHARIMLEIAGGINPQGLAVGGAVGAWLHGIVPALFLEPESVVPGAWVSAVLDGDSTILSVILTRALVDCALILLGSLLIQWGLRDKGLISFWKEGSVRQLAAVAIGFLVMGQAFGALLGPALLPSGEDFQDTGIGVALSTVWQVDPAEYEWLMGRVLPLLIPVVGIGIGLGLGWLLGRLPYRFRRPTRNDPAPPARRHGALSDLALLAAVVLPVVAFSFLTEDYFGLARTRLAQIGVVQLAPIPSAGPALSTDAEQSVSGSPLDSLSTPSPDATPPAADWQSRETNLAVPSTESQPPFGSQPLLTGHCAKASGHTAQTGTPTVGGLQGAFASAIRPPPDARILVNGQPLTLIGVNYNVNYTRLPLAIRESMHRRDFQLMSEAGVNAVIGWGVYDEVTLKVAQEYGIGVIMPFDLDPKGSYDNEVYRKQVKSNFIAFVNRFRSYPAVLAWNPGGDELLHRMDMDEHRTGDKLQAAADFLVELAHAAYSTDPNHFSVVKDARDWYLQYFEHSLDNARAHPDQPDPGNFMVYGVDIYGTPTNIAVSLWNARRNIEGHLRLAMIVGEYAPFGLARKDRPTYYTQIWDSVYANSPNGGFAYVFGPDQPNPQAPNPYDPLRLLVNDFSLVNSDRVPVDDTLGYLTARWCAVPLPN